MGTRGEREGGGRGGKEGEGWAENALAGQHPDTSIIYLSVRNDVKPELPV